MKLTASAYGHELREALNSSDYRHGDLASWHHPASPEKLVTWVESHDTYCNAHESAAMSDSLVRMGWVFLASRSAGTPLFFSRPAGSTRENYWGNNRIGARGNDEFKHPEVVAANKFRHAMAGQPEKVEASSDGAVIEVSRGNAGAAIINISSVGQVVDMPSQLPDGTYSDSVHGNEFKVSGGRITGELAPLTSYIIVSKDEQN